MRPGLPPLRISGRGPRSRAVATLDRPIVATRAGELYLDLLKKCLTRTIAAETFWPVMRWWFLPVQLYLRARGWTVVRRQKPDSTERTEGRDWPADAETMIGLKRLDNLQTCIERIVQDACRAISSRPASGAGAPRSSC